MDKPPSCVWRRLALGLQPNSVECNVHLAKRHVASGAARCADQVAFRSAVSTWRWMASAVSPGASESACWRTVSVSLSTMTVA
jgi:hypothetical protein